MKARGAVRFVGSAAAVLLLLAATACENNDDNSTAPDLADLNGRWVFAADAASPPATQACTGDLATAILTPFCGTFDLVLVQQGLGFSGSGSESFCGATWEASGVVSGPGFSGTVVQDDGTRIVRFTFSGTLTSASAGILDPRTLTVDGLSGDCTVFGRYNAARVASSGP